MASNSPPASLRYGTNLADPNCSVPSSGKIWKFGSYGAPALALWALGLPRGCSCLCGEAVIAEISSRYITPRYNLSHCKCTNTQCMILQIHKWIHNQISNVYYIANTQKHNLIFKVYFIAGLAQFVTNLRTFCQVPDNLSAKDPLLFHFGNIFQSNDQLSLNHWL